MKYFVNEFCGDRLGGEAVGFPNVYPNMYIGLFTECKTKGEGNFCGYYGAEYYLDTELLAYYVAEGGRYQPEKRIGDVQGCYFRRKKIAIGSHMWTKVIEANTYEEALDKFENAGWRNWQISDEGITVQDVVDEHDFDGYKHTTIFINDGNVTHFYEDDDIDTIDSSLLCRVTTNRTYTRSGNSYVIDLKI